MVLVRGTTERFPAKRSFRFFPVSQLAAFNLRLVAGFMEVFSHIRFIAIDSDCFLQRVMKGDDDQVPKQGKTERLIGEDAAGGNEQFRSLATV